MLIRLHQVHDENELTGIANFKIYRDCQDVIIPSVR